MGARVPDWGFRGYVELAAETLRSAAGRDPQKLEAKELTFLSGGFKDARDRMTTLATAVGTAGSFLLVLVALLVGFATKTNDQADKLVAASVAAGQLAEGCSDTPASAACSSAKLQEARADVERAQTRLNALGRLNRAQAVTGGLVMVAFLLGLAALLTNPVPGPNAADDGEDGVVAWSKALERLKTKRKWIIASLASQLSAIASIVYLGADVFQH
jgi:hypothetical protein